MKKALVLLLLVFTIVGCNSSAQGTGNVNNDEAEEKLTIDSFVVSVLTEEADEDEIYEDKEITDEAIVAKYLDLFKDLEEYQKTTGDSIRSIATLKFLGKKEGSEVNYLSVLGEYEDNYVLALTKDADVIQNLSEDVELLVYHVPINSEKGQEITTFVSQFK